MSLVFFNTMSGKKEKFTPLDGQKVKMYTCGPTVYDYAHIGNFRAYIFEDLLRRYLKYKGFSVIQVMNLTDIDDKTIRNSIEQGKPLNQYTAKYIDAFFEDLESLNIEKAEFYPRATEHIDEMITLITTLLDKGLAYQSDGSIYYKINEFKNYGKLSKKKLDKNIVGSRVDHDEYEREDLRDFVLWKKYKEGEPYWDSPFGKGRPGWHIECSAMSMKYLGESFDLHTGGEDNIFPHHENEIAQSEGATGKTFANVWMHCKFLLVDNEKMSKSKGNFYTIRDLVKLGFSPIAIRYLLLIHNYRHPLNFTLRGLKQAEKSVEKINQFFSRIKEAKIDDSKKFDNLSAIDLFLKDFELALDDDLNIAKAVASFFDFMSIVNKEISDGLINKELYEASICAIKKVDTIFAIINYSENEAPKDILDLLLKRNEARANKDYSLSDKIRDDLFNLGWVIEDTPQGARVKKK